MLSHIDFSTSLFQRIEKYNIVEISFNSSNHLTLFFKIEIKEVFGSYGIKQHNNII